MKTESIISLYSPLHSKVESGLEIATLAGSASNISLQEQSSEEEISQSARSFEEHLFGKWFFETSKNEIKSVWSSLVRTRRLTRVAVFLTSFLVVVVCLATFFTLWVSTKTQTPTTVPTIAPTTAVETMTTSRQACSSGLLTLSCEGVTNLNEVHELRWKIKFPDAGWNEFAYCGKSGMNCVVTKSELPEGIKVLEVSNRSVNLQRITKNNANGYAQTMSQVLFSNSSLTAHVYKINFTEKCVWIQERRDLNLTKILQSIAPCERVVHVEWYNINSSKFASCNSCQDCKKTSEDKRVQVFWNRLRVTRGSLLLTAIQEGDNDLSIRVKIEVKASGKSTGRDVGSVHMYTIKIFVNTSSPPDVVSQTVSVCGAESIAIMGPVNGSVQCQACLKCPAGEGLSVNCGDKISSSTPIVCKPCVLGETYSSTYEAGACKDCENCGPYRETTKACTLTSKAECGKCKVGAYVEPMLNMCTPCSQCCNDGKDIVISQCQVPGVPSTNQCSFARSGVCSKVVTTASVSAVSPAIEIEINHSTVQSTIPSTVTNPVVTSIPSEPIFALPVDAPPSQINVIVGSLFGGVFVVFILPLAIVIRCVMVTRRKNRGDKRQDKTGTQETKPLRRHANTGFKLSGTVPERPEPAFEFYGNTKEPERDTTVRVIVDVNCRAFPVRV